MSSFTPDYFTGLLNNILITVLSAVLPLGAGIGSTFLLNAVKVKGFRIAMRIVGALFYSLPPIVLLLVMYYNGVMLRPDPMVSVVLALTVSHLGYFMLMYDPNASAGKNIAVNSLGLLSSLFAWSFAASMIGCRELLSIAKLGMTATFTTGSIIVALIIAAAALLALNIPRVILKETMKR